MMGPRPAKRGRGICKGLPPRTVWPWVNELKRGGGEDHVKEKIIVLNSGTTRLRQDLSRKMNVAAQDLHLIRRKGERKGPDRRHRLFIRTIFPKGKKGVERLKNTGDQLAGDQLPPREKRTRGFRKTVNQGSSSFGHPC